MTSATLAVSEMMDVAQKGGTLGGQALLFGAVVALGWVVIALHKQREKSTTDIITMHNAQREMDRVHHEEVVATLRAERAVNTQERGTNFATLLKIAGDSANAMTLSASAANSQATATLALRETMHQIRDELHSANVSRQVEADSHV